MGSHYRVVTNAIAGVSCSHPRASEMALNKMGSKWFLSYEFLSCASVGGRIMMPPPPEGVHILYFLETMNRLSYVAKELRMQVE